MSKPARLILEDGSEFEGMSFGADCSVSGELVFNTGMVGYPESLTDPSYCGQLLVCTYPMIGNYGVPEYSNDELGLPVSFESERIQASALVVSEICEHYSHRSAARTLSDWLKSEDIPGISGVDTRAITKILRNKGSMLARIVNGEQDEVGFADPNALNLAAQVSTKEPQRYIVDENGPTVVLVDCGVKSNIIRSLLKRGMNVFRVPHDYYFLNLSYDGLVISNGPGDPRTLTSTIKNTKLALAVGKPVLGICMGIQILALAVGAETYKLKFGHRSHNQPCIELNGTLGSSNARSGRCFITSQNHGYAINRNSIPEDWKIWFVNANDDTIAGIRHISRPFMAVQFHPEATPGPNDTNWIFDDFVAQVKK